MSGYRGRKERGRRDGGREGGKERGVRELPCLSSFCHSSQSLSLFNPVSAFLFLFSLVFLVFLYPLSLFPRAPFLSIPLFVLSLFSVPLNSSHNILSRFFLFCFDISLSLPTSFFSHVSFLQFRFFFLCFLFYSLTFSLTLHFLIVLFRSFPFFTSCSFFQFVISLSSSIPLLSCILSSNSFVFLSLFSVPSYSYPILLHLCFALFRYLPFSMSCSFTVFAFCDPNVIQPQSSSVYIRLYCVSFCISVPF